MEDIGTGQIPTWCPGCGDYVILASLKEALIELKLDLSNTVLVSGIGCGSKTPHFIKSYGFEGLHGRIMPVATGIKLANHKLTVIGVGGDGDGYGIGGNHFIHTARRNLDITYVLQNNEVYGLTKGQYSPTSPKGFISPTTPEGSIDEPVNPVTTAITAGATFVARSHSMDINLTKEMIKQAILHKGFSVVDVLQLCPTYNKMVTAQLFKDNLYKLGADYDPSKKVKAFEKGLEMKPMPIGVIYREEGKLTYEDQLPQIAEKPLVKHKIGEVDVSSIVNRYR
ncbi:MAG TPA: 2-oxoacid:ferredoxin oxidoreductase subunit beta [Candidatus Nanoarchaeia archaeon]|nr:2-oxoacid:ferredoxin oxidoreductase subunit beta [Candidatus Nanoarchaeia archaeon]